MPDPHFGFLLHDLQQPDGSRLVELPFGLRSIDAETLFSHEPVKGLAATDVVGATAQYANAPADCDPALEGSLLQARPCRAGGFERLVFRSGERRRRVMIAIGAFRCSEHLKHLR